MRRFYITHFMVLFIILGSFQLASGVTLLSEGFEDVPNLAVKGWYTINHSKPEGITDWFNGDETLFPAQAGAETAYAAVSYNSTTGKGTINNWLITPVLNFSAVKQFSFYTRTVNKPVSQDRLEVRLSSSGPSINIGTTETDTGDFSTVLVAVNPDLKTGGYPSAWTQYVITSDSLPASGTGRIAFRYFITDGGPDGTKSDYIGIDTVEATTGGKGTTDPTGLLRKPKKKE